MAEYLHLLPYGVSTSQQLYVHVILCVGMLRMHMVRQYSQFKSTLVSSFMQPIAVAQVCMHHV